MLLRLLLLVLLTPRTEASLRGGKALDAGEAAVSSFGMVVAATSNHQNNYKKNETEGVLMHQTTPEHCGCSEQAPDWKTLQDSNDSPLVLYGALPEDKLGCGDENGNGVVAEGNRVAVSSRHNTNHHGKDAGSVAIYDYNEFTGDYDIVGDIIEGESGGEYLGFSLDLKGGDLVATGSIRFMHKATKGTYTGVARVYRLDENTDPMQWLQLGHDIVGENMLDHFGHSTSLYRTKKDEISLAVGAIQHVGVGDFPGYVKVFRLFDDHEWHPVGQNIVGDEDGDRFGNCVVLTSNLVAISAPHARSKRGLVKVYGFNGSIWVQRGDTLVGEGVNDMFGSSLSMEGQTLIVGAPHAAGTGAVYSYQLDPKSRQWKSLGTIRGSVNGGHFGASVSLNGRRVAIGAPKSGLAFVYEYMEKLWNQVGTTLTTTSSVALGSSISLSGDRLIVSAPLTDRSPSNHDHAGAIHSWELA